MLAREQADWVTAPTADHASESTLHARVQGKTEALHACSSNCAKLVGRRSATISAAAAADPALVRAFRSEGLKNPDGGSSNLLPPFLNINFWKDFTMDHIRSKMSESTHKMHLYTSVCGS